MLIGLMTYEAVRRGCGRGLGGVERVLLAQVHLASLLRAWTLSAIGRLLVRQLPARGCYKIAYRTERLGTPWNGVDDEGDRVAFRGRGPSLSLAIGSGGIITSPRRR
jgi:hypothetical protein